jgi:hypothetical protein
MKQHSELVGTPDPVVNIAAAVVRSAFRQVKSIGGPHLSFFFS